MRRVVVPAGLRSARPKLIPVLEETKLFGNPQI